MAQSAAKLQAVTAPVFSIQEELRLLFQQHRPPDATGILMTTNIHPHRNLPDVTRKHISCLKL